MTDPSVSIIVLNWNGRQYLSECLGSLTRQSYAGETQVVVVDNGSDDGSAAFIEQNFPQVKLIRSPTNLGFSAGNNLGARRVDSDLIAFLNNDTRADPRWLEQLVRAINQAPDIAAAGGRILSWDGRRLDFGGGGATLTGFGLQFGYGQPPAAGEPAGEALFACGGSMIVKRNLYWEVGGLDDDYFLFYEDVDLGWRCWLAGYRVVYTPESVIYHQHHGSVRRLSEQQLAVLYERNALYTIYKNYDERNLATVLPAALLLAAERATALANLDRSGFVVNPGDNKLVPVNAPRTESGSDWSKLGRSLRQLGLAPTLRRAMASLRHRLGPRVAGARIRMARRISGERDSIELPAAAVSRLLAMEQFGNQLPVLRKKREAVQRLRRRTDDEIIELFKKPLDPGFDAPGFGDYYRRVVAGLGLDQLVKEKANRPSSVSHS